MSTKIAKDKKNVAEDIKAKKKAPLFHKLSWIPALLMVFFIFFMSSQEADASNETSLGFTIMLTGIEDWIPAYDWIHDLVRQGAHFTEYMVFSFFVGIAVGVNGFRGRIRYIYMLMLSFSLSCMDEFYQVFVPGRYGDLSDVLTDTSGALLAVLFILILEIMFKRKAAESDFDKKSFMGIILDNVSFEEAIDRIMEYAAGNEKHYILTANADHIVKLQKDDKFREIYKHSSMSVIDGTPVYWIAESLNVHFKQVTTGADMFPAVCEKAALEGRSIFILGASDESVASATEKLKAKFDNLNIAGHYSPPMEFEEDENEIKKAIEAVNRVNADILVLALGSPKQEKFIYDNFESLSFKVALPFGASVDFVAGSVSRAPKFMRDHGLEWLYRFLQEPGRMFRRYFITDIQIFYYAWKYRYDIKG